MDFDWTILDSLMLEDDPAGSFISSTAKTIGLQSVKWYICFK